MAMFHWKPYSPWPSLGTLATSTSRVTPVVVTWTELLLSPKPPPMEPPLPATSAPTFTLAWALTEVLWVLPPPEPELVPKLVPPVASYRKSRPEKYKC